MTEVSGSPSPAGEASIPQAAPAAESQAAASTTLESPTGGWGDPTPPEAPEKRQIKPIPPKGKVALPGVTLRDPAELLSDTDAAQRDAMGRFLKKGGEGEPEIKPGDAKPVPVEIKPAPAPTASVKFLGKEVKGGIPEIEQAHRSLQGQFKNLTDERNYGYTQANGWKAEADRLRVENEALKQGRSTGGDGQRVAQSGQQEVSTQRGQELSVDEISNRVDMDRFERIAAESGLPQAGKYLFGETLKAVMEHVVPQLRKEFDTRLQPYDQQSQEAQVHTTVQGLIDSTKTLKTLTGEDAFPELNDPDTLGEIGEVWRDAGLPPEHALTRQGLIQAVALYRFMKGLPTGPALDPTVARPTTPQAARVASPAPGSAAFLPAEPESAPPNRGRSNLDPRTQEFLNSLSDVGNIDPTLGFAKNRPIRHASL